MLHNFLCASQETLQQVFFPSPQQKRRRRRRRRKRRRTLIYPSRIEIKKKRHHFLRARVFTPSRHSRTPFDQKLTRSHTNASFCIERSNRKLRGESVVWPIPKKSSLSRASAAKTSSSKGCLRLCGGEGAGVGHQHQSLHQRNGRCCRRARIHRPWWQR